MRQLFTGIAGQDQVAGYLQQAYEAGKVTHAYLLAGGAPGEASEIAKRFAAGLIAGDDDAAFEEVLRLVHPDIHSYNPAGSGSYLVDQIRDLTYDAELAPIRAQRKVYIINDAHRLSGAPANAFLKTLEEPPENVVCILVASTEAAVLETLRSRCEVFTLHASRSRRTGDPRVFEMLYNLALGMGTRDLLAAAKRFVDIAHEAAESDNGTDIEEYLDKYEDFLSAGAKKEIEQQGKRDANARERAALLALLDMSQQWLRDCLATRERAATLVSFPECASDTAHVAGQVDTAGLLCSIDAVTTTRYRISYNVTPQLAVEAMFLEIREALCRR